MAERVGGLGAPVWPGHQKPHHTEGVPPRTPKWLGTTTPPMGSRKEGWRLYRGPSDTARAGQRPAAGACRKVRGLSPRKLPGKHQVRQKRPPLTRPMAFGERSECKGRLWVSQGGSRTWEVVVSHRPDRAAPGGLRLAPQQETYQVSVATCWAIAKGPTLGSSQSPRGAQAPPSAPTQTSWQEGSFCLSRQAQHLCLEIGRRGGGQLGNLLNPQYGPAWKRGL